MLLVGFTHAQWRQAQALRGALVLKLHNGDDSGQVSRKEESRISTAGAVGPCLDKSVTSWGSQRHPRAIF